MDEIKMLEISVGEARGILFAFSVKEHEIRLDSYEYEFCIKLAKFAGHSDEYIQDLEDSKKQAIAFETAHEEDLIF